MTILILFFAWRTAAAAMMNDGRSFGSRLLSSLVFAGPQGAAGQQGTPGKQGASGAPGKQGLRGADGAPGISGTLANSIGARGPAGTRGPQGLTGAVGTQGVTGPATQATCPHGACLSLQNLNPGAQEAGSINISGNAAVGGAVTASGLAVQSTAGQALFSTDTSAGTVSITPYVVTIPNQNVKLFSIANNSDLYTASWDYYTDTTAPTSDGGYVMTGSVQQSGSNVYDAFITKYDASGAQQWVKSISDGAGAQHINARAVKQTSDGGYIIAGQTSFGAGSSVSSAFLAKLDSNGNKGWFKTWGDTTSIGNGYNPSGSYNNWWDSGAYDVVQTSDGGYAITGWVTGSFGDTGTSAFLAKFDTSGANTWSKTWKNGTDDTYSWSLTQTTDGGYAITGYTGSWPNNVAFLAKFDSTGTASWSTSWGAGQPSSVRQTVDGGYIIGGYSYDGTYHHGMIVKLDSTGAVTWNRQVGTQTDGYNAIQTSDGGYVLAGHYYDYTLGTGNASLAKFSSTGANLWIKAYGGDTNQHMDADGGIVQLTDGSFVASTDYFDHDNGIAMMHIASDGTMPNCGTFCVANPSLTISSPTLTTTSLSATTVSVTASSTTPSVTSGDVVNATTTNYLPPHQSGGTLTVTGNTSITGATSIAGATTIAQNSTTALQVQNTAGTNVLAVDTTNGVVAITGNATISGTLTMQPTSPPSSPTEGMVYYDATSHQLLTYSNGKWQGPPASAATVIVAASNSSPAQRAGAQYVATGTNDQFTINAALTAAAGGKVYLSEGTYTITGSISIPNNTTLVGAGDGTLITIPNAFNTTLNAITNTTTGGNGTGITIQSLRLDGNAANQTTGTINGLYLNGAGSGTGASAIPGAKITNISANNWRGTGIYLNASSNNILSNNTLVKNTSNGILLAVSSQNNTVTGNVAQGNQIGYQINASSYNTLTGNAAMGNTGDSGIYLGVANYNTVSSNTLQGNTGVAIHLWGGANNNIISGNNMYNNGGAGIENDITVEGSTSNNVTGNTITNTTCSGNCYAIAIIASSSGTILNNNTLSGMSGSGGVLIRDLGVGTIYSNQLELNGQLVNKATALTVGTSTVAGTLSIQGALTAAQLASPTAPTIANGGTPGTTNYSYAVTAFDGVGETLASSNGSTTTGNATLNATNYNIITWTKIAGATSYKIYRTISSGTPSTTGLIGTVTATSSTRMSFNDTGIAGGAAVPGGNTTGGASFAGQIQAAGGFSFYPYAPFLATNGNRVTIGASGNTYAGLDFMVRNDSTAITAESSAYTFTRAGSYNLGGNITNQRGFVINAQSYAGAFTIQNAATMAISGAPTVSGGGTITNAYSLWTQGGTVRHDTGSASTVGQIIRGAASQTGDLLQLQNSSGNVLSKFNSNGDLQIGGTSSAASATAFQVQNSTGTSLFTANTSTMTLTFAGTASQFATLSLSNAHLSSNQTTAPTAAVATCTGTPTVTAGSTDTTGSFSIAATSAAACAVTVTFNSAYGSAPKGITITPKSSNNSAVQAYVSAAGTTSFTVTFANAATSGQTYTYYYMVIQ